MTATTYYTGIADAQRILDTHITSSANGRCIQCGRPGPCPEREDAVSIFSRSLRLPLRRPGASRPELISARRVA